MYDKRLKKFEEFKALHFEEGAFVTPAHGMLEQRAF
jgi:hypothetical protein